MRETRKLLVKLSEAEMQAVEKEHSDVCLALSQIDERKKEVDAEFREEKKPFEQKRKALEAIKKNSAELRDVECEAREADGRIEVVRLDTGDVVDHYEIEPKDTAQPALPFARPEVPTLLCSALDDDGMVYSITAEQADAAEREIADSGRARVEVEGDTFTVTKVVRGKACSLCGIVGGHHRPECESMRADQAAEDDGAPESYDPNDTAQVAATIDQVPPPPDGPVRGVETATRKVTPKRAKKGKANDATEAEGVH